MYSVTRFQLRELLWTREKEGKQVCLFITTYLSLLSFPLLLPLHLLSARSFFFPPCVRAKVGYGFGASASFLSLFSPYASCILHLLTLFFSSGWSGRQAVGNSDGNNFKMGFAFVRLFVCLCFRAFLNQERGRFGGEGKVFERCLEDLGKVERMES